MSEQDGVLDDVKRLGLCSADIREGWTELLGRSYTHEIQFDRQRGRICLEVFDHLGVGWVVGIPQNCDSGQLWIYFLEQLQPFGVEFARHHREPGDVPPRMRQALDQAGPDRIEDEGHNDGDSGRGTLSHLRANSTVLDDHVDFALDQVSDQLWYTIVIAFG